MSFKIEFGDDWNKLRKSMQTEATVRKILPDVSVAILKLHNTLERRVGELFTAPTTLSSVMIGSSKSPAEISTTFLRYNLQYRDKPIPLANYANTTISVANDKAKIPYRVSPRYVRWTPANEVRVTTTAVRRGKQVIPRRVKGSRIKGFLQHGVILARRQQRTWEDYPGVATKGKRAPVQQLWGPKLTTLASKVYDVDTEVAKAKEILQTEIISAIIRSYS